MADHGIVDPVEPADHRSLEARADALEDAVRSFEARVNALEAHVAAQAELLQKQQDELLVWQRWWETYGQSMSWYFHYPHWKHPQPMTYREWCRDQKRKEDATPSPVMDTGGHPSDPSHASGPTTR